MAVVLIGTSVSAQPAKRRTTTSNAVAQKGATSSTTSSKASSSDRATLQFPAASSMPDDVVWKRDIYRQLDLLNDKNAPMYYPVEPNGRQMNLFTYLFRLILTGRVTAYAYKLDGNESFEEKDKMSVKDMLERYNIYYEEKDGKITVADSDIPSAEATRYYLKESTYLDQRTGTFSTQVTALCPILMRGADEFSTDATPYPLFWVRYDDIASYLTRLPMMGSNLNNVSNLTAHDYFTLNHYEGQIYKTNNLQGRVLPADSTRVREQKRIEQQLKDFEENIWHAPKDSLDSIAAQKPADDGKRKSKKSSSTDSRRSKSSAAAASKRDSGSSSPRVSARRQRR